ncbi:unnamed protein product [Penicillium olsonii]|uniref:DUF7905 domain-containing protein n=1 Tax=Penicillium olsonii TaxID=99116 RepID=A0A9W4HPE7_PENOL|nr:unnamed protein product [Penicillium olsonii]
MVRRFVEAAMPDATMPDSDEEEKKLGWKRISAHSNIKSVTDKLKEVNDAKLERLRHAPETRTDCKYIFLWPPHGEPSLKDGLDLRRQWLDEIRAAYDVYIYTESGNKNCLYLSANSEANLCNVSNELRAMRQALSVRAEGGIKLFLVEPPTPSLMKTEIRVEETDGFAKPFLHGNKLPQEQALAWSSRAQAFKQDNKDVIQGHLGRALVSVPPSNGVLQMRAKFGTFTLDEWTKPATGDTYQFKEFRDILRRDSVAGRLLPGFVIPVSHCSDLIANIQIRICLSENELFKRIREAKDLLVPWGDVKLDSLLKIAPRHSASFDFQAGTDGIIRVEVNFLLLEGTSEFEVSGSRCFKPRKPCKPKDSKEAKDSKGPIKPMQIGMIDFERADWELEIKALELHPAKQHSAELRKFKHSIRYVWNPSSSSIGSMPQRKAKFHPSAPITRFVEKSAIQLSVIGTAYTFELARFDDYLYANHRWAKSPKVSWGASLFNPEWDELLTTQAHGGTIYDTSCLSSFFQASPETVAKAMEGMSDDEAEEKYEEIQTRLDLEELRTFMSKVQTLARMLGSSDFEAVEVLNADLGTLF